MCFHRNNIDGFKGLVGATAPFRVKTQLGTPLLDSKKLFLTVSIRMCGKRTNEDDLIGKTIENPMNFLS